MMLLHIVAACTLALLAEAHLMKELEPANTNDWIAIAPSDSSASSASSANSAVESLKLPQVNRFLDELKAEFVMFKKRFQVAFTTVEEEGRRFVIFAENFMHIKRHNQAFSDGKATFEMAVNKFADRTPEEMKQLRGYRPSTKLLLKNGQASSSSARLGSFYMRPAQQQYLPVAIDWRKLGAVTPVKDQGQCGSCYAFSTTGSLEGQHFRKSQKLVSLSEQQIVDCSSAYENQGCNGGLMDNAFTYIKENVGLDTEKSYPYTSGRTHEPDKKCLFHNDSVGATDTGFIDLPSGDEEALMEAVANKGPISVAIDASASSFQFYRRGVYTEESCHNRREELDHGVLVVGYGVEKGIPYWLVKNSWAATWGDGGYLKMRRNYDNMCGIATQASYPLV